MKRLIRITIVSVAMVLLTATLAMAATIVVYCEDDNPCRGDSDSETIIDSDKDGEDTDFSHTILAGDGDDIVSGLEGNDDLNGGGGDDTMNGGSGNDRLRDRTGDDEDRLNGAIGKDRIIAADNDGDDILRGGKGKDVCVGDKSDTFRSCEVERIR